MPEGGRFCKSQSCMTSNNEVPLAANILLGNFYEYSFCLLLFAFRESLSGLTDPDCDLCTDAARCVLPSPGPIHVLVPGTSIR